MKRFLLPLLFSVLPFVSAQEFDADFVAMWFANELNGITTECPHELALPSACYELSSSEALHKLQIESLIGRYGDVNWVIPWQRSENSVVLGRAFILDNGDAYLISLWEFEPFTTIAFVTYLEDLSR